MAHRSWTVLVALVVAVVSVLAAPATARADEVAERVLIEAQVRPDGTLAVNETIVFSGDAPETITQRLALTRRLSEPDVTYRYDVTDVEVSADDAAVEPQVSTEGDYLVVQVSPPADTQEVSIDYVVRGATHPSRVGVGQAERTTISWRFLQGLSVGAEIVQGVVEVPGMPSRVECLSGPPTATTPCTLVQAGTHDAPQPLFLDGPRGPGEVVVLTVETDSFSVAASEKVRRNWSLDRAFSLTPLSGGLALGSLLLGGLLLWLLHRRAGRDLAGSVQPARIAEFAPVGAGEEEFVLLADVRPGHVGTVTDERVDPVDVTGTLLDLAVRGHLRIHELPRSNPHHPLDWAIERREAGRDDLRPYEQLLRDAVAPPGGEPTRVSEIAEAIAEAVPEVQSKLYDDVVDHGWFERRPDDSRDSWATSGWIALTLAVVVAGLLVAFTPLGLWGLALVALALGLVFVAQEMPRRSARGTELLAGLRLLSSELQHHRTDQMPPGREYQQLSRILPYAVVLGGSQRWLQALAAADGDEGSDGRDLDWYHADDTWHLSDLPVSVDAFVTSVEGHLFRR